jgi:hypothetical protein
MKTVVIDLYKFEELSDVVKIDMVNEYREQAEYFDDGVIEDLTHFLVAIGFSKDVEIDYSLDYSHVPYANVIGEFTKKDFTEAKNNYRGDKVLEIFDAIENLETDCFEADGETDDHNLPNDAFNLVNAVNSFIFTVIENDCENYYSTESIVENIISADADYMADGTLINAPDTEEIGLKPLED